MAEDEAADVREDEEQSEKLQEIIDLLVAAGYFRARIKNLSSFDRVVGGMTWCIESCNVEVDVDLLFQENLTIGQKIALTEKIVAVLPQIQCPHPIEPHQIQGLDFIHIFPVIQDIVTRQEWQLACAREDLELDHFNDVLYEVYEGNRKEEHNGIIKTNYCSLTTEWLVKRSMEFRKDVSNSCYSFAVNQFEKHFSQDYGFTEKQQQFLHNIQIVNEVYKPHRVFRRTNVVPFKDLGSKVQITLLEYGYRTTVGHTENENIRNFHLEGQEINQIMDNMAAMNEETFDYDELPEEDREKISDHYKKLTKQFKISNCHSNEKNKVANLMDRREDLIDSLEKSNLHKLQLKENVEDIRELIKEIKLKQIDINGAITDLESDENNSEKSMEVERLLLHGDNLEKQKTEFEENCAKESLRLTSSIEAAEKKYASSDTKCDEFDSRIENENEKLKVLRLQMAKKNRAISILQRRIDEVPSRAELAQYQKRFIELYNQTKHKETKQYYSLYNTLEDTRQYMKKELSLLNSIIDNYPEAMRSKEGKEEFLQQFLNILEGVKHSKLKLEKRLSQEKKERDELGDSLHSFIEMNRKYATAIKVLKAEFLKNEEFIKNVTIDMV